MEGTAGEHAAGEPTLPGRLTDLAGGLAFVVDHDLRCLVGEGEALRAAGMSASDITGRSLVDVLDPTLAARLVPQCQLALAGRAGVREHVTPAEACLTRAVPLHDADGGIYAALIVSFDLTSIRRGESVLAIAAARDRLLVALADAIRPSTGAAEIARTAAILTCRELGASQAVYVDATRGLESAVIVPTWRAAAPGSGPALPRLAHVGETIVAALARGERTIVSDTIQDPRLDDSSRAALAAASIGALVAIPLSKAGRVLAVFLVAQESSRAWTPDEVALIDDVAERTRDAIGQARTEARLRDNEARLTLALEASGTGTFLWHLEEERGEADARALELFGLTSVTASLTEALNTLVHPADRQRLHDAVKRALDPIGAGTLLEDVRVQRADGTERWIAITARSEFRGAQPRAVRVVGLVSDVSARKQAEAELREREEQLRLADRRKDEFLAMLAHELRNPLAPIRAGLEIIRLGGDNAAAIDRVRAMMERQVGQMVRLIDDLLDVSRITSGKICLQRQPTALTSLIGPAIDAHRSALVAGGLALELQIPEARLAVDVDVTRAVQVLSNVLHNAVKFTEPGGSIRVAAAVEPAPGPDQPGLLAVTIADTGIGIAPELVPRLFDLFSQGRAVAGRPHGGLGIGLALARRLIELQGGSIAVHSDGPGRGSTFTIRLPLAPAPADPPPNEIPIPPIGRRVVVIDDHEDALTATAMLIHDLGGDARVARDGMRGVAEVLAWKPHIVLLDLGLPDIDGFEACRRIRQVLGSSVVIVALSGWGQVQDKADAIRAGFDAHLTKPADPLALARLLSDPPEIRRG